MWDGCIQAASICTGTFDSATAAAQSRSDHGFDININVEANYIISPPALQLSPAQHSTASLMQCTYACMHERYGTVILRTLLCSAPSSTFAGVRTYTSCFFHSSHSLNHNHNHGVLVHIYID